MTAEPSIRDARFALKREFEGTGEPIDTIAAGLVRVHAGRQLNQNYWLPT